MQLSLLSPRALRDSIPSIFEKAKQNFPDALNSVSQPNQPSLQANGLTCWEIKGPALQLFDSLREDIDKLLADYKEIFTEGEGKSTTIQFQMFMVGTHPASANPTIVFSSKSSRQRKYAKTILKTSPILDNHPYVRIKTMERMPAIPHAEWLEAEDGFDENGVYLLDDVSSCCGARVELGRGRRAILGGVLLIGDKYTGITAQHARWDNVDEDDEEEIADPPCFDADSDDESEVSIEITSKASISSFNEVESFNEAYESWDTESESNTSCRESNDDPQVQIKPRSEARLYQTPPGGCVAANSLHRKKIATLPPEHTQTSLDYELFELEDTQWHRPNTICVPDKEQTSLQQITPTQIAQKPAERAVWAAIGGEEPVKGTILAAPHYLKMKYSPNFQEMWVVRLERQTTFGDCGAWVIDAVNADLYGHIVAGDPVTGLTYIIPACAVAADIENRSCVEPVLPFEQAALDTVERMDPTPSFSPTHDGPGNPCSRLHTDDTKSCLPQNPQAWVEDRKTLRGARALDRTNLPHADITLIDTPGLIDTVEVVPTKLNPLWGRMGPLVSLLDLMPHWWEFVSSLDDKRYIESRNRYQPTHPDYHPPEHGFSGTNIWQGTWQRGTDSGGSRSVDMNSRSDATTLNRSEIAIREFGCASIANHGRAYGYHKTEEIEQTPIILEPFFQFESLQLFVPRVNRNHFWGISFWKLGENSSSAAIGLRPFISVQNSLTSTLDRERRKNYHSGLDLADVRRPHQRNNELVFHISRYNCLVKLTSIIFCLLLGLKQKRVGVVSELRLAIFWIYFSMIIFRLMEVAVETSSDHARFWARCLRDFLSSCIKISGIDSPVLHCITILMRLRLLIREHRLHFSTKQISDQFFRPREPSSIYIWPDTRSTPLSRALEASSTHKTHTLLLVGPFMVIFSLSEWFIRDSRATFDTFLLQSCVCFPKHMLLSHKFLMLLQPSGRTLTEFSRMRRLSCLEDIYSPVKGLPFCFRLPNCYDEDRVRVRFIATRLFSFSATTGTIIRAKVKVHGCVIDVVYMEERTGGNDLILCHLGPGQGLQPSLLFWVDVTDIFDVPFSDTFRNHHRQLGLLG